MSIPEKLKSKYFFHFTHLDNLDSIVQNGLLCTNEKKRRSISHHNVASETIQDRRSGTKVPCGPKGNVHDYVPFYLCSLNPMFLSLVNSKNIDQQFVIFFAISIDYVNNENVIFTDASANTVIPPNFYTDPSDLEKLDWDAISTRSWGKGEPDHLHRRMSEVMVHQQLPITDVDYIIVWNDSIADHVKKTFEKFNVKCPIINFSPFKSSYNFHFSKFFLPKGNLQSLVTGPFWLKKKYEETIKSIVEERKKHDFSANFSFRDAESLLNGIEEKFNVIPELDGIFKLETVNDVHSENVSDHTLNVVNKLINSKCFANFNKEDQDILKLSAYLHDIGKGPKSKWRDGKQPSYPDHPVDALPMLQRIFIEEVELLDDKQIRIMCLLVAYHDLIGEIISKGRDIEQLFNIIENENELNMLACLNRADVKAINTDWLEKYELKIDDIKKRALEKLKL